MLTNSCKRAANEQKMWCKVQNIQVQKTKGTEKLCKLTKKKKAATKNCCKQKQNYVITERKYLTRHSIQTESEALMQGFQKESLRRKGKVVYI